MTTENQKHTPGPWTAICPDKRIYHEGIDITTYEVMTEKTRGEFAEEGRTHYRQDWSKVDNVSIVSCHFWRDMEDEEAKANARLIAAAPELLEALKDLLEITDFHELYGNKTEAARRAIAKAT